MDYGEVRVLVASDLNEAVRVMSDAFFQDPLWSYLYPNEVKRRKWLTRFFAALLPLRIGKKEVFGIGTPLVGVAVWNLPDNKCKTSFRSVLPLIKLAVSPFIFQVFKTRHIFSSFEEKKKKYVDGPHFYLQSIGIETKFQGRGYASKLMLPFIEDAKSKKYSVYTETMTPTNVRFYEHYGFQCMEEFEIKGKGVCVWCFCMES